MITFMIYLNIRKMIVFVSLMKLRQDAILLSCEVHAAESWQTNLDKDWFRVFPTAVQPSWEFIPCLLIPHCHDFDRQISQEVLHLLAHWEGFKPTSPKMAGIKRTCGTCFFKWHLVNNWHGGHEDVRVWVQLESQQQVWNFNALHLTCLNFYQFLVWSILWLWICLCTNLVTPTEVRLMSVAAEHSAPTFQEQLWKTCTNFHEWILNSISLSFLQTPLKTMERNFWSTGPRVPVELAATKRRFFPSCGANDIESQIWHLRVKVRWIAFQVYAVASFGKPLGNLSWT